MNGRVVGHPDTPRTRDRLLRAAARLIGERGVEHVSMEAVAKEAGVGKATLFRRFGDRGGLLLALFAEAEAGFQAACASGPPPLGPGAPPEERLAAFGRTLVERITTGADPAVALARHLSRERRYTAGASAAHHRHLAALLREAGPDGDPGMLAHVLLAFLDIDTLDHLYREHHIPLARLQAAWTDLVRRVTLPGATPLQHPEMSEVLPTSPIPAR